MYEQMEWLRAIGYMVLAAIGGFLGYVMRTLDAGEKIDWFRACIETAGSAFVGFIAMLVCLAMKVDPYAAGAIIGVLGYLGAKVSIQAIEYVLRKKLNIPKNNDKQ